jgi:hypothetical protein
MGRWVEDPAFCRYGAGKILALTEDLTAEFSGVRERKDLEYIHRLRVATRRLRAGLRTFRGCAGKERVRRVRRALRRAAAALGAARDLDVQIGVLEEILSGLKEGTNGDGHSGILSAPTPPADGDRVARGAVTNAATLLRGIGNRILARIQGYRRTGSPPAPSREGHGTYLTADPHRLPTGSPRVAAVECLLLRARQQRAALQPRVERAVDRLDHRGVAREVREMFQPLARGGEGENGPGAWQKYLAALLAITPKQEALLVYGDSLQNPGAIREHHAMRIAAKRYRYTLEILNGLYGNIFDPVIRDLKGLQDLLGEVHDCDVWVQSLPGFIEEEQARSLEYIGHDGFFRFMEPGFRWFGESRAARRSDLHAAACRFWQGMNERNVWETVITAVSRPLLDAPSAEGIVHTTRAGDAVGNGAVGRVTAVVTPEEVILTVPARHPVAGETAEVQETGGPGEEVFGRQVVIRWSLKQ